MSPDTCFAGQVWAEESWLVTCYQDSQMHDKYDENINCLNWNINYDETKFIHSYFFYHSANVSFQALLQASGNFKHMCQVRFNFNFKKCQDLRKKTIARGTTGAKV